MSSPYSGVLGGKIHNWKRVGKAAQELGVGEFVTIEREVCDPRAPHFGTHISILDFTLKKRCAHLSSVQCSRFHKNVVVSLLFYIM